MARPSKLTNSQCAAVHLQYNAGVPVPKIAKKHRVSESSIYKVLDGTYKARIEDLSCKAPLQPSVAVSPDIHPRRRRDDTQAKSVAQLALEATLAQMRLTQALADLGIAPNQERFVRHAGHRRVTHALANA